MLDETGGWKAATTALWREHLHAATQIGRVAAAAKAVELGYGITADSGPSGRLRHWRIAGIGDEILELHSKRAAATASDIKGPAEALLALRGGGVLAGRPGVPPQRGRGPVHRPVGDRPLRRRSNRSARSRR